MMRDYWFLGWALLLVAIFGYVPVIGILLTEVNKLEGKLRRYISNDDKNPHSLGAAYRSLMIQQDQVDAHFASLKEKPPRRRGGKPAPVVQS